MNASKALLGVATGVAAGAVLGLLFAPEKGTETRKKIVQKKDDYVHDMNQKYQTLKSRYNELIGNVSGKVRSVKGNIKSAAENGKAKLQGLQQEVKSAVHLDNY